jgi:hypothetical protein
MKTFIEYLTESESIADLKKLLFKLERKVFKVMPRSPLQKSIIEQRDKLKAKLKEEFGYDYDKEMMNIATRKLHEEYLTESIPPTVYHVLDTHKAISILSSDKYKMSPAFGTGADMKLQDGRLYFMSTSWKSNSGYAKAKRGSKFECMFELDGDKLAHNIKGKYVDYWGGEWRDAATKNIQQKKEAGIAVGESEGSDQYDENEVRLLSNKPIIENFSKYVKAVHILDMKDKDNLFLSETFQLMRLCKEFGIPSYAYSNFYHWLHNTKSKAEMGGDENTYTADKINAVIGLVAKNNTKDLTTKEKDTMYRLNNRDIVYGLEADVHNSRTSFNDRTVIENLGKAMLKMKANNIKDLIDKLSIKWQKIRDDEENEKA